MAEQLGGHLGGLDPHPQDLDLIIEAAQELHDTVGGVPATVAGAEQDVVSPRVRHETLRGRLCVVEIAQGAVRSPDGDLAWHTWLADPPVAENEYLCVRQRAAQWLDAGRC